MGLPTVYGCVGLIGRIFSSLPICVCQRIGVDGDYRIIPNHPLARLLESPNVWSTQSNFFFASQANLSLYNEVFIRLDRNNKGRVREMLPASPGEITLQLDTDGELFYFDTTVDGGKRLDYESVMHVRGLTTNGVFTLPIHDHAREAFGLALALQQDASLFFGNGSRPGLIVQTPGRLSETSYVRLKASIDKAYSKGSAWQSFLLEEGATASYPRINFRDSQHHEGRQESNRDIARIFGVPAHLVGLVDSIPRANAEEANREFETNVLRPIAIGWEQTLNKYLLTSEDRKAGIYFWIDTTHILRSDTKTRYESWSIGRQNGWLSINDIRRKERLPPIKGGDDYLTQPLNMQSNEQISEGEATEGQGDG